MRGFPFAIAILAAGCAAPPPAPPPAAPAAPAPSAEPFEAWDVVGSRLEIRVYRDGPMEKLGHNHLITSDALTGTIELREPRSASAFRLELPLESLAVDDSAARATAGPEFAREVPERDREATRRNMLGEQVLDAARQPAIVLTADAIEGGPADFRARVRLALRAEERVIEVPLSVALDGGTLRARAQFALRHADLGLMPFTAAMGALRVRDGIEIDFRLEARRRAET